jgi:hypothetical protein
MCEPESRDTARASSGRTWIDRLGLATAGLIGLVMAHHPTLFSGFARIQTATEDPRLINYLLEHSYLWIRGKPPHRLFWDIPIFYPMRNVAAFSDTLLTVAPAYWGWRALGFLPDTAFQLWMLTNTALNYLAGYWLMRVGFRRGILGSIGGAFLFAFAAARTNQIEHQQLTPQVYTVVTLTALLGLFRDRPELSRRAWILWSIAGLSLAAQFYASFYLGWFLVLALGLAAAWGLGLSACRPVLVAVLRGHWPAIVGAGVLSILAIGPLAVHYLSAAIEHGQRPYLEVDGSIPDWQVWVNMGPESWLFGWMARLGYFNGMVLEQSKRNGLGVLTPMVCLYGLWSRWREPVVRLAGLTMLGLLVAIMRFDRQIWEGMALGLWWICGFELAWRDWPTGDRRLLGGSILILSLTILRGAYPAPILLLAILAFLTGRLGPGRVPDVARVAVVAASIGFPLAVLFDYRRPSLANAGITVLLVEAGLRLNGAGRRRLPRTLLVVAAFVAATLWLFVGEIVYWRPVAGLIPGGHALRVVSRGLLLGIIPAALGLACFLDRASSVRRRQGLTSALALVCLLEQGVTTTSFDKSATRDTVASLARRVDGRRRCFYYSPRPQPDIPKNAYHLDAMWAEIETGIPTVNGYSGLVPPKWHPLDSAGVAGARDRDRLGQAIESWASLHSMRPDAIDWIVDP